MEENEKKSLINLVNCLIRFIKLNVIAITLLITITIIFVYELFSCLKRLIGGAPHIDLYSNV